MIGVIFDPARVQEPEKKDWWKQWQGQADEATDQLIERFEDWLSGERNTPLSFKFQNPIWRRLKDWLMEHVFNDKCAYCERLISGYYGDAEHFRPKGAVNCNDGAGELVKPSGQIPDPANGDVLEMPHPGYFWLAYDWRNLVPS